MVGKVFDWFHCWERCCWWVELREAGLAIAANSVSTGLRKICTEQSAAMVNTAAKLKDAGASLRRPEEVAAAIATTIGIKRALRCEP
jgi:hypothetical protein